jgi:hypothetical protein
MLPSHVRGTSKNTFRSSCKASVILLVFTESLISTKILVELKISSFDGNVDKDSSSLLPDLIKTHTLILKILIHGY